EVFTKHYFQKLHMDKNLILTEEGLCILKEYNYPGNIRELKNILERFKVFCFGVELNDNIVKKLIEDAISPMLTDSRHNLKQFNTLNLKEVEQQLIDKAMEKHNDNR